MDSHPRDQHITVTTVVILHQNMQLETTQTEEDAKLQEALSNMHYKACTANDIAFLHT